MLNPTKLKSYAHLFEAEVAVRELEAHNIAARLSTDQTGGPVGDAFSVGGVHLFVDAADRGAAHDVLAAMEKSSDADES